MSLETTPAATVILLAVVISVTITCQCKYARVTVRLLIFSVPSVNDCVTSVSFLNG